MSAGKSMKSWFLALLLLLLILGGSLFVWDTASPQSTCASCHEIESSSSMWAHSGHRGLSCNECHGSALSSGFHSLKEKGMMIVHHFTRPDQQRIELDEAQMLGVMDNCRRCHGMEYAEWLSGGHSATYQAIFLDKKHNAAERLNADCLRCHGMFYRGTTQDLVFPISVNGPWSFKDPQQASKPAIPCFTCHMIHRPGDPVERPEYADPGKIFYQRPRGSSVALFYDRYEKAYFESDSLPLLHLSAGERAVKVSADPRQRICTQCHAPNAFHRAGTSDDRTPRGVHEGISCVACHEGHSNDARHSCINCHPAISNCGLDVTKMNTSFVDPSSPHDIHVVQCTDCHTKGIPKKKPA